MSLLFLTVLIYFLVSCLCTLGFVLGLAAAHVYQDFSMEKFINSFFKYLFSPELEIGKIGLWVTILPSLSLLLLIIGFYIMVKRSR